MIKNKTGRFYVTGFQGFKVVGSLDVTKKVGTNIHTDGRTDRVTKVGECEYLSCCICNLYAIKNGVTKKKGD